MLRRWLKWRRRQKTAQYKRQAFLRPQVEQLESRRLLAFDFGDAPDSTVTATPNGYPTRLVDDGARHEATGPSFGTTRDTEDDGNPHPTAQGEDLSFDGGATRIFDFLWDDANTIEIYLDNPDPVSNKLDGWIDFNRDGDWNDDGEQIFDSVNLGTIEEWKSLPFTVPRTAAVGDTFARLRLSTMGDLAPTGAAADGEVEDHRVSIKPQVQLGRWTFDSNDQTSTVMSEGSFAQLSLVEMSRSDWVEDPATHTATDTISLRFPQRGYATGYTSTSVAGNYDMISFWIKPEFALNAGTDPHVVMQFVDVKIVLGSWTTGVAGEVISLVAGNDPIPSQITSVTGITRNAHDWTHVAFAWSKADNRYKAFVDGYEHPVTTLDSPAHVQRIAGSGMIIGRRTAAPHLDLQSKLDDIRFYRGSFSNQDILDVATSLIARWNFDEHSTSSQAWDQSGNGRHLQLNAIDSADWLPPATDRPDNTNSLRFPLQGSAVNNHLNLHNEQHLDTIAFWLKPEGYSLNATTDPRVVMEFGGTSGVKIVLGSWTNRVADEVVSLVMGNDDVPAQITSVAGIHRDPYQWTHVAFVWSPSDGHYKAFIDGVETPVVSRAPDAHVQRIRENSIRIGGPAGVAGLDLRSHLDDIRLYQGSVGPNEIKSLASRVQTLARYGFDEDLSTAYAWDSSGRAHHLSLHDADLSYYGPPATTDSNDKKSLRFAAQTWGHNNALHLPTVEKIDAISFWLKLDSPIEPRSDPRVVMEFGGDEGAKIVVGGWTPAVLNESFSLVVGNGAIPTEMTAVRWAFLPANEWLHFAFVWSESNGYYSMYVNGVAIATISGISHVRRLTADTIRIGSRNASPHLDLRSYLDDVRLYTGDLTIQEIRSLSRNKNQNS